MNTGREWWPLRAEELELGQQPQQTRMGEAGVCPSLLLVLLLCATALVP